MATGGERVAARGAERSATPAATSASEDASGVLHHTQRFQSSLDRLHRPVQGPFVVAKLVGEVRAEEKRVDLERELLRIDIATEMAFVFRHVDRFFQSDNPVIHPFRD